MTRLAAIACNVALFAFTLVVLATDGASGEPPYVVFQILLLATPVMAVAVLAAARRGGAQPGARRASVLCNLALLAFSCWAIADQYPHPADPGLVPFVVLLLLTPVLSSLALVQRPKAGA